MRSFRDLTLNINKQHKLESTTLEIICVVFHDQAIQQQLTIIFMIKQFNNNYYNYQFIQNLEIIFHDQAIQQQLTIIKMDGVRGVAAPQKV